MIAERIDARNLTQDQLAATIQYTNVKPNLTRDELIKHVETSAAHKFDAAMVAMCWVPLAREILHGTHVKVATCFGLALGNESLHAKIMLTRECFALGADQVDQQYPREQVRARKGNRHRIEEPMHQEQGVEVLVLHFKQPVLRLLQRAQEGKDEQQR